MTLSKDSTDHNPMELFQKWFYEAENVHNEAEVNAMCLLTLGLDNFPKNRIVLLKRFSWEGFTFFTNYNSEKGKSIQKNPQVSIIFNWINSRRNIIIEGLAEKTSKGLSDGYFDSRPRNSKLGCWASQQSEEISSRKTLDKALDYYNQKFKNKEIPRPKHWGGYLIKPQVFEFIESYDDQPSHHETYTMNDNYDWVKEVWFSHNFTSMIL